MSELKLINKKQFEMEARNDLSFNALPDEPDIEKIIEEVADEIFNKVTSVDKYEYRCGAFDFKKKLLERIRS